MYFFAKRAKSFLNKLESSEEPVDSGTESGQPEQQSQAAEEAAAPMAEAVVDVPTRFYCHMCNVEINIPNTDFTCPLCAGGFVEELPANAPPTLGNASNNATRPTNPLESIRDEIATLLMSRSGPNVEISIDPGSRRGNLLTIGGGTDGAAGSSGNVLGGGRVRPPQLDRLDNVLLEFLQSLTQGGTGVDVDMESGGVGVNLGPFGAGNHMFFMGNPGDYAWGREGIDAIVTQLLNQMETSGPPPLAKDKIAEIPTVAVTADDVSRKLQCSVCWEDFKLEEQVRKLPCSHIYHENCIVPWLDLHGTCPICRKSLAEETENETENSSNSTNTSCPVHRNSSQSNFNPAVGRSSGLPNSSSRQEQHTQNSTAANAPMPNNQQPSSQNNVFGFDVNDDVDLD